MNSRILLTALTLLLALPAQARFGKGGSSSGSSSSSSSHSSSSHSSSSSTHHGSAPVGSHSSSSSSPSGYTEGYSFSERVGPRYPWRYGYYSGAYVPMYGYGYGYLAGPVVAAPTVAREETQLRLTAGVEAMTYVNGEVGVTALASVHVEGEAWGFYLSGQNIAVKSVEDPSQYDLLQQVSARVTYSFLNGRYGRLRAELGADTVFAQDLTALGPTGGFSGSLWVGGPFALEGAIMVTPLPFWQLDYKAGVAVGLGPVGLRAGWRTQVLDDRGLVDGVAHRDVFMGPYVGAALAF